MTNLFDAQPLPPEIAIFGRSKAMEAVRETVQKIAVTNLPVMISGESGTGKEVIAKLIHSRSPWRNTPFVKIACQNLRSPIIKADVFEWKNGISSGGHGPSLGGANSVQRCTLFLDDITELAPSLQAGLLDLLRDGQFCPTEGHEDTEAKARFVCATNRNLEEVVEAGRFRQDLYYRLSVVRLNLPPLRHRCADIPLFLNYLMEVHGARYGRTPAPVSPALLLMFKRCEWPGNILQLENLIKRYIILGSENAVTVELLQCTARHDDFTLPTGPPVPLKSLTKQVVQDFERQIILRELEACHWKRKEVARVLRISYGALLNKMRNVGLLTKKDKAAGPLRSLKETTQRLV